MPGVRDDPEAVESSVDQRATGPRVAAAAMIAVTQYVGSGSYQYWHGMVQE